MKKTENNRKNKKTVKTTKKRKKNTFSDTLKAFLLVGMIVICSMCVSLAIIHFVNLRDRNEDHNIENIITGESIETIKEQSEITEENKVLNTENIAVTSTDLNSTELNPAVRNERPQERIVNPQIPAAVSVRPRPAVTPNENRVTFQGNLIFVIDDAGNNLSELEPFLRVPGPLTIAVLPGLPHSAEAARRIRNAGKEVILHQPMEALGGQNPGPGAIYSGMTRNEIRDILKRNIAEVGPVAGINNHQGSKITTDREIMETILEFCIENRLYFLDSRTTADTVAPSLAREKGIKIAQRNFFLDNEQSSSYMRNVIETALARAKREGSAVLIGHTWSPELAPLLTEQYPLLTDMGYRIRSVSEILR